MFADLTETEYKQWLGTPLWKRSRLGDDPDIHWPAADIPDVELPKVIITAVFDMILIFCVLGV